MSVIKDIQLNSSNLCNVECMDKNATVHPETCADQVLTTHSGAVTLTDWIDKNETTPESPYGSFDTFNSLHSWLETNYPIDAETITLPVATTSTLGAIKVGQYLSINSTGVLSVDKESLDIPEIPNIDIATTSDAGTVKLGSSTSMPIALNGNDYQTVSSGKIFPLKLDSNSRAGIFIPNAYHKVSWSEIDDANDYVKNNTLTINYGGQAYEFTSNGSTNTSIDISSITYSAGEGIDINNSTIKQTAATSSSLGGIKTNYSETSTNKPVKTDVNGNAYVSIKPATGAWIGEGLSQHYFEINTTIWTRGSHDWVPIMRIDKPANYNDGFKINAQFQIISRHALHYFGEYYINYKSGYGTNNIAYSGSIVNISTLSEYLKESGYTSTKALEYQDIVVQLYDSNDQLITDSTGTPQYGIVYRKIKSLANTPDTKDVFIVNILGNNNTNTPHINDMTYYCTSRVATDGSEELISNSDYLVTGISNPSHFSYLIS